MTDVATAATLQRPQRPLNRYSCCRVVTLPANCLGECRTPSHIGQSFWPRGCNCCTIATTAESLQLLQQGKVQCRRRKEGAMQLLHHCNHRGIVATLAVATSRQITAIVAGERCSAADGWIEVEPELQQKLGTWVCIRFVEFRQFYISKQDDTPIDKFFVGLRNESRSKVRGQPRVGHNHSLKKASDQLWSILKSYL